MNDDERGALDFNRSQNRLGLMNVNDSCILKIIIESIPENMYFLVATLEPRLQYQSSMLPAAENDFCPVVTLSSVDP